MRLSIVTPSFNQGKYISQTFESILGQKKKMFEIEYIVMDGGSRDETPIIAKKYAVEFKKKGIRFVFKSKKDKGQADAINQGWKMCTGDIVTYINSDDFYEPGALEKVVSYFQKNTTVCWAYGGWKVVNEKGELFRLFQQTGFEDILFKTYGANIGQPACFFRKTLLGEVGVLNQSLHLALDYDLWLRFLKLSRPGIIPAVLANLRYYRDAKSAKYMVLHNHEAYLVAKKHLDNRFLLPLLYFHYLIGRIMILLRRNISQQVG